MSHPIQSDYRLQPDPIPTEGTVFENRYPTLEELLQGPGVPGVEYLLVPGGFVASYHGRDDGDGIGPWQLLGSTGAVTIRTDNSGDTAAVLLYRGTPITAGMPTVGLRAFYIAKQLDELTGLLQQAPDPNAVEVEVDKPKPRRKATQEKTSE